MLHEHQVLVQAGDRKEECLALRKPIYIYIYIYYKKAKRVIKCPKPIEDCKVGPEDWLVC